MQYGTFLLCKGQGSRTWQRNVSPKNITNTRQMIWLHFATREGFHRMERANFQAWHSEAQAGKAGNLLLSSVAIHGPRPSPDAALRIVRAARNFTTDSFFWLLRLFTQLVGDLCSSTVALGMINFHLFTCSLTCYFGLFACIHNTRPSLLQASCNVA